MSSNLIAPYTMRINGFAWVLRPLNNRFGLFSLILLLLVVVAVWLVSLITYQYQHHYFDQLRGIYPPMFATRSSQFDVTQLPSHLSEQITTAKEHFSRLVDVCIDDNKGVGFRPVRTSVRSLDEQTLLRNQHLYHSSEQPSVWISAALYEVIFGEPATTATSHKELTLIAKPKRSKEQKVNIATCQTNADKLTLPIAKVLHLASNERWLILRKQDVRKLNVRFKLSSVVSVYSNTMGMDEQRLYTQLSHFGQIYYWRNELPNQLQLNMKKLQTRFLVFLLLALLMLLSFFAGLYLLTQKQLQENIYLLRFYGVAKGRLFTTTLFALLRFYLVLSCIGFGVAWMIVQGFMPGLFATFSAAGYFNSLQPESIFALVLGAIILPMGYLYWHFWQSNFNQRWRAMQR